MRRHIALRRGDYFVWMAFCGGLCIASNVAAAGVQISAAPDHIAALKSDGTVWQWGDTMQKLASSYGRCGYAVAAGSDVPVQLAGLTRVTAIAAASGVTLALKDDGTVWGWGQDGTLDTTQPCPKPNGTLMDTPWAVKDPNDASGTLTGVNAIWARNGSFFARKKDGSVWAWGDNNTNKLGVRAPANPKGVPRLATPLHVVQLGSLDDGNSFPMQIVSGVSHTLALQADGSVRAWSGDAYGERGDQSYNHPDFPYWNTLSYTWYDQTTFAAIGNVSSLAAGVYNSLATTADGKPYVWGQNRAGELGGGFAWGDTTPGNNTPSEVAAWPTGKFATAVALGNYHSMFLLSDGTLLGLGYNGSWQLGTSFQVVLRALQPFQVPGINNVTAVDAAADFTVALRSDGTVWQWGSVHNHFYTSPTQVGFASPLTATASCGSSNGLAFNSTPIGNLCLSGSASSVSGSGPWTWQCSLPNGSVANCNATRGVAIITEPVDRLGFKGRTVTFDVLAHGSGTLQYQWYKGSLNAGTALSDRRGMTTGISCISGVSGSKTRSLTLAGLCGNEAGSYYVVVTDQSGGSATSDAADLNYLKPVDPPIRPLP